MSHLTYFVQECPTCGRRLQIRVQYLGKKLVCQHCQGEFEARDPANTRCGCAEDGNSLLRRADELLKSVARRKAEARSHYPR
jgi:DNA-directed RNA polymerase subunit M/transcription elongation factor TFIIS